MKNVFRECMNTVFLSNYFNHHQKPISDKLFDFTQCNYTFIANSEMRDERKQLGYTMDDAPKYVLNTYKNEANQKEADKEILNADVIIIGSAKGKSINSIIRSGKLIFRYSERPLKFGLEPLKYFPRLIKWHIKYPKNKPIYLLCASAYTALDYRKFGLFANKAYKWGYFPETKYYNDFSQIINKKNKTSLLWCGRYLDWKHPIDAIMVAKYLKDDGYKFELNFIGRGKMQSIMQSMIDEYRLNDCVHILGAMSPEKVRDWMEHSGIYLFTSDRQEGWGAVLNEAMNSGCAVVASHLIGSVPFLINDGANGLIYKSGNVDMLYQKVKWLLDNPTEQVSIGIEAYHTIVNEWNAEVAAKRFVNLTEHILSGDKYPDLYKSGPCSKAEILRDRWYNIDF